MTTRGPTAGFRRAFVPHHGGSLGFASPDQAAGWHQELCRKLRRWHEALIAGRPVPRYKVGNVRLPVSTAVRQLSVVVTPDRLEARPGEAVQFAIQVRDSTGRGVAAELSVAVVDKALLALQEERGPDGLASFWFARPLGVSTSASLLTSVERANDTIKEYSEGGGKGGAAAGTPGAGDAGTSAAPRALQPPEGCSDRAAQVGSVAAHGVVAP